MNDKTVFTERLETFGFTHFRADAEGRWTQLSPGWEKLTGAKVEDSLGEFVMERIHPEDWVLAQPAWARLLRGESESIDQQIRLDCGEHGLRRVNFMARVEHEDRGEGILIGLLKLIGPAGDTPEAMSAEQPDEQIMRLAGGLAHEFNNMLQGISSSVELLKQGRSPSDPDYQCCEIIENCSERLSDVVSQLVAFARVGHHNPIEVDFASMLRGSVARAKRAERGAEIALAIDPRISTILADHAQMTRAIDQLLDNSVAAAGPSGKITVSASLFKTAAYKVGARHIEQTRLRLIFEDNGRGFSQEALEHALEPFYSTLKSHRGMGLSVTHSIIQQHGGSLRLTNAPSGGARVTIEIPHHEALPSADHSPTLELQAWDPTRSTLLLVDDEPDILKITSRTLTEAGYDVLTATNGEHALELYARHQKTISLCILDYIMPGLSGDELFDAFRRINPNVELLICTGYDLRGSRTAPRRENILFKPYTSGQLVAMIQKHRAKV